MPLGKIHLRPGITAELTPTLNEGGFSSGQLIRFFAGQLQKYGGWARIPGVPMLAGLCRGLYGWADQLGVAHIAAGTDQRLYVLTNGVLGDITPIAHTSNIAPALSNQQRSILVSITDSNYTPNVGDWINVVTPISNQGYVVSGAYQVVAVFGPFTYMINISPQLTGLTSTGGGTVPTFSTVAGSALVTVTQVSTQYVVGGSYNVPISTTVGGLILFGNYTIAALPNHNSLQITGPGLANATASVQMNGGLMQIQYLLGAGVSATTPLGGWGVGDWGAGDWGLGDSTGGTGAPTATVRTWSLDHFGQNLIASPNGGPIYTWAPSAVQPANVVDPSAPIINNVVFGVAQAQIIVACGSEVGGTHFPTLIRWCDSGDFTAWVASATNQAGSYQLPSGSFVVAAVASGLGALIWTDTDVWSMTYQGLPFVFGFNQLGVACEALSKKAPAVVGSLIVWPSRRGFFQYQGAGVMPVECPVWDIFFDNLDPNQTDVVFSAVNTSFNEVAWFFPQTAGGTGYVKWNYLENVWDYGTLDRTAWVDHSPYGGPYASDSVGFLYAHETGADADTLPLISFAQSGYYDIQDGNEMAYVNTIIPDFIADAGTTIQLTILATDYPGTPPRSYGPYTITPTTRRINVSLRGRQIAFRIGSSDLGSFWRMGAVRYSAAAAGRRP